MHEEAVDAGKLFYFKIYT